jgi:hypothetical protein
VTERASGGGRRPRRLPAATRLRAERADPPRAWAAQEDNRWLRFDDSNVTTVPLSRVLDDKAYLLFYQLRG